MENNSSEIRNYWDKRGRTETLDERSRFGGSAGFREHPVWLGTLPVLLGNPAGGRVIRRVADMGCGTGIMAGYLAQLGYEVIAVEFAESRAELARQRLAPYPHAVVRLGDAANPPIVPGEVDAVVSRNLLWLLPDPKAAVMRWAQLTGSNGRIAAIDSLQRLDHRKRSRSLSRIRQVLRGQYRRTAVHSAELSQVAAAPLSNIAHPQQAGDIWLAAGIANVHTENLAWITAVKHYYESPVSRALALSQYYAVLGDS